MAEVLEATVIEPQELAITYQFTPAEINVDLEAVKATVEGLIKPYEGITAEVVAHMDMKEAKGCRAHLNSISTQLNEARKAIKKIYNEPFNAFEAKVKEIDSMIKAPRDLIDEGIKRQEELEKEERRKNLEQVYEDFAPALVPMVPFDRVLDPRWLNKSYGEKKAENALCDKVAGIAADWEALKKSNLSCPEDSELKFFETLNLREALDFDREQAESLERLSALKAEVAYEEPVHEGIPGDMGDPFTPVSELKENPKYRFSIEVPFCYFETNIDEANALKNHLTLLGIPVHMTKSKEAING